MTELPAGWVMVKVADVGSVSLGRQRAPKYHQGSAMRPYLRVANVFEDRIDTSDVMEMHFSDEEFEKYRLALGDILLNEGQSPHLLGRPAVYRGDPPNVAFTNSLIRFRAGPAIRPKWALAVFRHYMHSKRFMRESRITTNIAHLSAGRFAEVEFPVPPLPEQERVVAAIEEQFSRLEAGATALERVRQNLKRMRAAVLQAAVSGTLVPSDTSEPSLAERLQGNVLGEPLYKSQPWNWVTIPISAIADVTSGATPLRSRKEYWQDGMIPWVTSALVNHETISQTKELVTELALRETSIKLMPVGTLLVAMYGEGQTRGRCSELLIEATTNQACAGIVLRDSWGFVRPYVKLALMASYEANRRLSSGGVQPNLSVGIIKGLRIALPPQNEQRRICDETARQLSFIDHLEVEVERQNQRATSLRSAVLGAALCGKLVPQDPCDEPASVLLERTSSGCASPNGRVATKARSPRRRTATA